MHESSQAQIIYNNISPDLEIDEVNEFYNLDIDENGNLDFAFGKATSTVPYTDDDYYLKIFLWAGAIGEDASIAGLGYSPYALMYNDEINGSLSFDDYPFQPLVFKTYLWNFLPSSTLLSTIDKGGQWYPDIEDHYLGIRFIGDDGYFHYGWLRCTVEHSSSQLRLKDYAYNAAPEQPIAAGMTTAIENINAFPSIEIFCYNKQISLSNFQEAEVSVYDLNADLIFHSKCQGSLLIDFSSRASGNYLVRVVNSSANFSKLITIY